MIAGTHTRVPDGETDRIHEEITDSVSSCLPSSLLAFTSGSLPYGGAIRHKSDADINVVFPDGTEFTDTLASDINRFVDRLSALHDAHGLNLDRTYPGEYLTLAQARDAAAGRGVPIVGGVPTLPRRPGNEFWNQSEQTWYLPWLGALAFSRRVAGDPALLAELRSSAWHTVLLMCLPDLDGGPVTPEAVLARLMANDHPAGGFGIHPGYTRFATLEAGSITQAMASLTQLGYLRSGPAGTEVDAGKVAEWQCELAQRHGVGFTAPSLLTVATSRRLAR